MACKASSSVIDRPAIRLGRQALPFARHRPPTGTSNTVAEGCTDLTLGRNLYIYPVFCTVYLLRENGQRPSPDEVQPHGGVGGGYVMFGQKPVSPEMIANLHPKQGDVQQLHTRAGDGMR